MTEWSDFFQLEPWGYFAEWQRTASLASLMANLHGDRKRHPRPYRMEEFMPRELPQTDARGTDPKIVRAKLMQAFGHRIKKRAGINRRQNNRPGRNRTHLA